MKRLVVSIWLCLVTTASAQEKVGPDYSGSYLCKTMASGGLVPDKDDGWRATTFNVADHAYVVKVTDTMKRQEEIFTDFKSRIYTVGIKEFGTQDKSRNCYGRTPGLDGAEVASVDGDMRCGYLGTEYLFDFKTLKFQTMFRGGYMDRNTTNRDTPYVSVGKCEKID